ncbi:hypothetical protein B0H14DRAFT_2651928 [Mycena olivaceomarginata]|nr:hypothetical protein B0H14DRAFT_2651928 [Mycena olivaceomarginata]
MGKITDPITSRPASRPQPSGVTPSICGTLPQRDWTHIQEAYELTTDRHTNVSNTEDMWEPVYRGVSQYLAYYATNTKIYAQRRIWLNPHHPVPFNPNQTHSAPATNRTKIFIPDLTAGNRLVLIKEIEQIPWFHPHGFVELKRASSRKLTETIRGRPVNPAALMRLMKRIRQAIAQGEGQAALHFKQLHSRLKNDPDVLKQLPKRFYILVTSGPWFTAAIGFDPFQGRPTSLRGPRGGGLLDDGGGDAPDSRADAPHWSQAEMSHGSVSRIGAAWEPHIFHLTDPAGWGMLAHIRSFLHEELQTFEATGWKMTFELNGGADYGLRRNKKRERGHNSRLWSPVTIRLAVYLGLPGSLGNKTQTESNNPESTTSWIQSGRGIAECRYDKEEYSGLEHSYLSALFITSRKSPTNPASPLQSQRKRYCGICGKPGHYVKTWKTPSAEFRLHAPHELDRELPARLSNNTNRSEGVSAVAMKIERLRADYRRSSTPAGNCHHQMALDGIHEPRMEHLAIQRRRAAIATAAIAVSFRALFISPFFLKRRRPTLAVRLFQGVW